MNRIILVKYGEIILKGLNRGAFERMLVDNMKRALGSLEYEISLRQATIYVEPKQQEEIGEFTKRLSRVFGIIWIVPCAVCEKKIESICETALEYTKEDLAGKRFKVESKRADKHFPMISQEISTEVGGYLLEHVPNLTVDVHNPDETVTVEIRENGAYVYCKRLKGQGGLPTGSASRAMLLLSGGIDSPVAGYMMAKRGLVIEAVNFFSHPYTSERAKEKVLELAKILSGFTGKVRVHIVPFTEIQLAIRDLCPEEYLTLIMRRIMMRIAQQLAEENHCKALITGESLGQVASQTTEALGVTNDAVSMPVFRPLIGMDKVEITQIAERIGTYETSILPYEDCCTVFTPRHPVTKPKLTKVLEAQKKMPEDELVEKALAGVETIEIDPDFEI